MEVKLWRGGGQDVAHSNEDPYPQGSSLVTLGAFLDCQTFKKNGIIESANRPDPTVETIFIYVKPSDAK
jgi:hypothetical protein